MPFNVGFPEMMLIMLLALIIFGPGKLPEIGGAIGKAMREFRRASSELTEELTREVEIKKEQDRRTTQEPNTDAATSYVPAQTQAFSQEPASVASEPLLGVPQDGVKPVPQAPSSKPEES
jgi:TatA/E family protein of Tat protein translocase